MINQKVENGNILSQLNDLFFQMRGDEERREENKDEGASVKGAARPDKASIMCTNTHWPPKGHLLALPIPSYLEETNGNSCGEKKLSSSLSLFRTALATLFQMIVYKMGT